MRTNIRSAAGRLAVAAVAASLVSGTARAQNSEPVPELRVQWAGVELLPLSANAGPQESFSPSPPRFRVGLGGTLRGPRLPWTYAYWTPLEVGLFYASGGSGPHEIILVQALTEGGGRLPVAGGTLELGAALGLGALAIGYDTVCDGECAIGGKGVMLSPVVRYVVQVADHWRVGFVVRAAVPLQSAREESFAHVRGFGTLVMGGVDVAVGS